MGQRTMYTAELFPDMTDEPLQAGDLLGKYQLVCPVARGGMGQVWAARQTGLLGLPGLVAIKTALPSSDRTLESMQTLLFDEARVAASIDHPNICKILELGFERGVLFIAMEWIFGVPLSNLLSLVPNRKLDCSTAAYILAQACRGLHAAHELTDEEGHPLEVVHRDATPHNMLITLTGDLKIVDFGIVKARNQLHQVTETGELKGKISYLAPEQLRGKGVDRRSDIFTLGCVLYLATTGRAPFNGLEAGTTVMRIMNGEYAPPSSLVEDYPEQLEQIVCRALALDPNARFQTAQEMQYALEAFLNGQDGRAAVARTVEEYCGAIVEQRRADIRAAQKLLDSQAGHMASGTYRTGTRSPESEGSWREEALRLLSTAAKTPATQSELVPTQAARSPRHRWLIGGSVALVGCVGALIVASQLQRSDARRASEGSALRVPSASNVAAASVTPAARASTAPARTTREPINLTLQSRPEGAKVRVDGGPAQATPRTLQVPPDDKEHVITLQAPGYEDIRQTVRFNRDQVFHFDLLPKRVTAGGRGLPRSTDAGLTKAQIAAAARAAPERARQSNETSAPQPSTQLEPTLQPLLRQAPRHQIDQTDPFARQR
ncbi:MAG TPA: serine/threonine-protein kinase [Polyangiaceae bacterium]|nr:serine/threonine-protein kinase [Polyangiaceae bacterium]